MSSDGVYSYRKFNGVKYQKYGRVGTKREAESDVRHLRNVRGRNARITKAGGGNGYDVWWAFK